MSQVEVAFFMDIDGTIPAFDWLSQQSAKVQSKCHAELKLLRQFGHELRRPHCDYLRDGIYELRVRLKRVQYRILYFFDGTRAVVLCHGLTKLDKVPFRDIDNAVKRKAEFTNDPEAHAYHVEDSYYD